MKAQDEITIRFSCAFFYLNLTMVSFFCYYVLEGSILWTSRNIARFRIIIYT